MDLQKAEALAISLMRKYKLDGYVFRWDSSYKRMGMIDYDKKTIYLSPQLTYINQERFVRDTILHEIAHAYCPDNNHGPKWRAVAKAIGCRPRAKVRVTDGIKIPSKFRAVCHKCGEIYCYDKPIETACCTICYKKTGKYIYLTGKENPWRKKADIGLKILQSLNASSSSGASIAAFKTRTSRLLRLSRRNTINFISTTMLIA